LDNGKRDDGDAAIFLLENCPVLASAASVTHPHVFATHIATGNAQMIARKGRQTSMKSINRLKIKTTSSKQMK